MRRVYLIRHAHPDFPLHAHMCLGRTDTPLGPLGRMQACLLGESFRDKAVSAVFSSPLTRCRETATPLGLPIRTVDTLAEQDMGPWDGLDFDTIRERWPELYARRAIEPLLVPPGAETLYEVHKRVLPALFRCLEESEGDIAVVVHASVMQAILAELCGIPLEESRGLRPPYCGVAVLEADETLRLQALPLAPCPPLTPLLAEQLLLAAAPGERVTAHCRAVASESMRIAEALPLPLDRELLVSAALLHDAARGEPHHAALGAAWLNELGYSEAAALISQHHDLKTDALDEAAILYLADKCIREDLRVSVEERFRDSAVRCRTDEGCAAHARRYAQAQTIRQRINSLCGYELVE